jgi:hypothetical protein
LAGGGARGLDQEEGHVPLSGKRMKNSHLREEEEHMDSIRRKGMDPYQESG